MNNHNKQKWDKKYLSCQKVNSLPNDVLMDHLHLLPKTGLALDLACGYGANAICLAEQGLTVSAWDISSIPIKRLEQLAKKKALPIKAAERDLIDKPPLAHSFDVIVVGHFLDRGIIPHIRHAIKPAGLIFYQTFIKDKINDLGPKNPDYLLGQNELLSFFKDWHILFYHEEGKVGDITNGFRNQAMLIGQKPHLL